MKIQYENLDGLTLEREYPNNLVGKVQMLCDLQEMMKLLEIDEIKMLRTEGVRHFAGFRDSIMSEIAKLVAYKERHEAEERIA